MGYAARTSLPLHRLASFLGAKATQHVSAAIVGLLALNCGMALGWTSAAASVEHGGQGFLLSAEEWSWVGATLNLGAMLGSLSVGALIAPWGRHRVCLGLAPLMCAGWALHVWASNVWMLLVGRALVGLAFGATCVVVPIFTSELAESSVRGALGSYLELFICGGVLTVYLLGGYLPLLQLNACCLAVPVVFAAFFSVLPDSPRWLLSRGRREDARDALAFYRGAGVPREACEARDFQLGAPSEPRAAALRGVDAELGEIERAMQARVDEPSLAAAFKTRAARRGMALAVGVMLMQQLTGIDAVTFYASQIFEEAGTLSLTADQASMVMAAAEIASNIVSLLVVDGLGRRPLLMASSGVMALCCTVMGTYFYLNSGLGRDPTLDWVPVLVSSVYMVAFAFGLGPIAWLFVGEIFPDRVKGVASSIANTSNWLCAFVVTKFFPTLNEAVGTPSASFWAFGACCAASALTVGLFFPETKGKTLDEIQDELNGSDGKLTANLTSAVSVERRRYGSVDSKV